MAAKAMPLNLIESTLVPHSGFSRVLGQLEQVYKVAEVVTEPVCKPLIAESRTGKTRAIAEFVKRYPPSRSPDGLTVPVLTVKTPSKPTVKGLVEVLLSKIGDPRASVGTEQQKTARLIKFLKSAQTRVTVVDEFQHFVDRSSQKVQHHAADWLKVLLDESGAALVVAGLETSMAVLHQNEQLRGRFLAPARLSRFDWSSEGQRSEFVAILSSFEQVLSEYVDLPGLANANMGFRVYVATGGLIGYLTKLLNQLVWNAVDAESSALTLEDFSQAFVESIALDPDGLGMVGNPFVKSFDTEFTARNFASALQVGVPTLKLSEPNSKPKRSRGRKPSVGGLLTAT